MKIIKDIIKLAIIWIGSIVALAVAITIYIYMSKESATLSKAPVTIFLFLFYSVIFSFPAFIFFVVLSLLVLNSKLNKWKKKFLMILINYIDIAGTVIFLVIIAKTAGEEFAKEVSKITSRLIQFYPCWVLVGVSTILILLIPFNNKILSKEKN